MIIKEAQDSDFDDIWKIFKLVVSKGDTYVYSPNISKKEAYEIWMTRPIKTLIAQINKKTIGTYYIKENYTGLGNHICSCGYMVSPKSKQKGFGTAMCQHSQKIAIELGFHSMQFNYVISTNTAAINLWKKLGFNIVGTVPNAHQHKTKGFVDIHIMIKTL